MLDKITMRKKSLSELTAVPLVSKIEDIAKVLLNFLRLDANVATRYAVQRHFGDLGNAG